MEPLKKNGQPPTAEAPQQAGMLEEYRMLRSEVMNCINLHNTLCTFMITAVGAILTFSLLYQQPLLFLLPYAVIIPIQCRIFHYRQNMMKISAYMIVCLEPHLKGIQWETRHKRLADVPEPVQVRGLRNYEGFMMALACLILLVAYSLTVYGFPGPFAWGPLNGILLAVAVVATLYVLYLCRKTNRSVQARANYMDTWREIL